MSDLPESDSLKVLQEYILRMNKERQFTSNEDPSKKMLMLTEEVGELAKAVRTIVGMKFSSSTQKKQVTEELADVLIVLLGLSAMHDIKLFEAFKIKEQKNRRRIWK